MSNRLIDLPWWLTIGLAVAAYHLLDWAPQGLSQLVLTSPWDGIAKDHFTWMAYQMTMAVLPILQVLIPVLLASAGVISMARRLRRSPK